MGLMLKASTGIFVIVKNLGLFLFITLIIRTYVELIDHLDIT